MEFLYQCCLAFGYFDYQLWSLAWRHLAVASTENVRIREPTEMHYPFRSLAKEELLCALFIRVILP